jgi:ATP-dependent RNA helicase SUPV3L1/SUV3
MTLRTSLAFGALFALLFAGAPALAESPAASGTSPNPVEMDTPAAPAAERDARADARGENRNERADARGENRNERADTRGDDRPDRMERPEQPERGGHPDARPPRGNRPERKAGGRR